MLGNTTFTGSALGMRPANSADAPFLETLYRSSRPDLQRLDLDADQRDALLAQQYQALQTGAGTVYPDAMHFVAEQAGTPVGALIVDFGHNEVRLIYLALVPAVRGQGLGRSLLQGLQQAAARTHTPLAVTVWRNNPRARQLYLALGFTVEESAPQAERLVWYPDARPMVGVR